MAGLPKKYAKMGFKRGWKAYNLTRRKTRKSTKSYKPKVVHMARRRKYGFRKHSRKSGSFSMGSVVKVVIGAGIAALYEIFVSPMIPLSGMVKNLLEMGIGAFLMMGRFPMPIKAFGAAMLTINAYSTIVSFLPAGGSSGSNFD